MYSIGNEIPDTGNPAGAAHRPRDRRADPRARRHPPRHQLDQSAARVRTRSSSPRWARGVEAPSPETGRQHDDDDDGAVPARSSLQSEIVDERTAESFAYLDVAGYNYTESRYAMDHELHPQRVIVGSETNPAKIAPNWAAGARAPARDRRLHLDRMGLPRRVGHRAHAVRRRRRVGRRDRWPHGLVPVDHLEHRRHRHHRVPAAGLVLARDRLGAARRAVRRGAPARAPRRAVDDPQPAGRSPTPSHRGRGPASRASPSRSRCTPTPTRWSSS